MKECKKHQTKSTGECFYCAIGVQEFTRWRRFKWFISDIFNPPTKA